LKPLNKEAIDESQLFTFSP